MDDKLRTDEETTRLETPHTEGVEGRRHTPALEQAEQRSQSHKIRSHTEYTTHKTSSRPSNENSQAENRTARTRNTT